MTNALPSPPAPPSVLDLVASARRSLRRLSPAQALESLRHGAVLVDVRTAAQRAADGDIPQAMLVDRTVLEWRFDPASEDRLPIAAYDLQVIVLCSHGYTSSLAAAALQQLGVRQATDVDGGFHAWRAAGLPVVGGAGPRPLSLVPAQTEPAPAEPSGPIVVKTDERRAYVEGRELDLTRKEFDLLAHLVAAPYRVHTRAALLTRLWDGRMSLGSRTVDVHVHRLRAKLGELGDGLQTVRGVGYRWTPPSAA